MIKPPFISAWARRFRKSLLGGRSDAARRVWTEFFFGENHTATGQSDQSTTGLVTHDPYVVTGQSDQSTTGAATGGTELGSVRIIFGGKQVDSVTTRVVDESSTPIWTADHGADMWAVAAGAGCFYTGGGYSGGVTTRKYDEAGTPVWTANHNGTVYAIAVDSAGTVYTGGLVVSGATTRKYDSSGTQITSGSWPLNHGGTVYCIAVDSDGNVYTGGDRVLEGSIYYKIRKYNSAGVQQWAVDWQTGGGYAERIYAIAVDNNGYVYATKFRGTASLATVRKLNASTGSTVWSADIEYVMAGVAVDSSYNVYVCGQRNFGNNHLFQLNSSGTTVWAKDPGGWATAGTAVALDVDGNVYATAGDLLVKYNHSGTWQWEINHGFITYSVATLAASRRSAAPALAMPVLLSPPWHTLYASIPALAMPVRVKTPTWEHLGFVTPDIANLPDTITALARYDGRWTPYTGWAQSQLAAVLSPIYIAVIATLAGAIDQIPMTSLQCRRRVGTSTWLAVNFPYTPSRWAVILDSVGGELMVNAGIRTGSGVTATGPFLRATVTEYAVDTTAQGGVIQVTARVINPPFTATGRALYGIRTLADDGGRAVVTCDVDPLLRPNDTVNMEAHSFVAGTIEYRINPQDAVMTVTETL